MPGTLRNNVISSVSLGIFSLYLSIYQLLFKRGEHVNLIFDNHLQSTNTQRRKLSQGEITLIAWSHMANKCSHCSIFTSSPVNTIYSTSFTVSVCDFDATWVIECACSKYLHCTLLDKWRLLAEIILLFPVKNDFSYTQNWDGMGCIESCEIPVPQSV